MGLHTQCCEEEREWTQEIGEGVMGWKGELTGRTKQAEGLTECSVMTYLSMIQTILGYTG